MEISTIKPVTRELLIECHNSGVSLWIDNGFLVFGAYEKIDPELRERIEQQCTDLMKALEAAS